jgi:prolyl oligopeptidase
VATPPTICGRRYFYERREGLKNQPYVYLRQGSMKAPERVILDPNVFSEDGTVAVDWSYPSPDGSLYLYGRSSSGTEKSTLHILDVATGRDLPDVIPDTRAASVAWLRDGSAFYYVRHPAAGSVPEGDDAFFRRVYFHRLGTDPKDDTLVAGEGRPKEEWTDVSASSDWRYVFLTRSIDWAKNDLFVRPLDGGKDFTPVAVGLDGQVQGDTYRGTLFLRTNVDAPRYRIVKAPIERPGRESWVDVVPEGEGVIENFGLAGDRLVVQVLENAHSRLLVYDLAGKLLAEVKLPTLGTVSRLSTDPGRREAFFQFTSYVYPTAVLRLDAATGALETVEQLDPGVDLSGFTTEQVWFQSKDGTRVPMFVVRRGGGALDGKSAALLSGYGGFEISETPSFARSIVPWLEGGGVYAEANLRGGGEFGRTWHEAGRLERKQNVFDDMIAAAECLVREGYTSRQRLAIEGGSNGGLLTGACVVQRPDLFRAAVVAVPLLDMLRYQRYSIARLWIPEYGSADDPAPFPFLYAYSPYHHVVAGTDYPAVLLRTAESDSRVEPIHAMKMAARLQAATSGTRPILLRVETKAGHGQGKPVSKQIDEALDTLTFLMWQTGMIPQPAGEKPQAAPTESPSTPPTGTGGQEKGSRQ